MALDIFNIATSQGIDPILYHEMQPFIQQAVSNYGTGRNLTERDIDRMTEAVVMNSRRRGLPAMGYGGMSLNEAVRLLILLNLFNYGYNMNPFWYLYFGGVPFFLLPFIGGGRRPPFRPRPPIGRPPHRPGPGFGRPPNRRPPGRRSRR